jgi:hypothetical protein
MMMEPHSDSTPPLVLPMSFFVTGLTGLAAALITLTAHTGDLALFLYGRGPMLAATHLMTLAFVSMVMMGPCTSWCRCS